MNIWTELINNISIDLNIFHNFIISKTFLCKNKTNWQKVLPSKNAFVLISLGISLFMIWSFIWFFQWLSIMPSLLSLLEYDNFPARTSDASMDSHASFRPSPITFLPWLPLLSTFKVPCVSNFSNSFIVIQYFLIIYFILLMSHRTRHWYLTATWLATSAIPSIISTKGTNLDKISYISKITICKIIERSKLNICNWKALWNQGKNLSLSISSCNNSFHFSD